jgi:3-oxoadipate enol-lactonase
MKQTRDINGIRLAFEDHGEGEALVLIHGLCGSSAYWDKVIPELSKHYRVIAPDLRGHGESGVSDEAYVMKTMANDISELLEKLHISQAIIIGHSLGGYVALALAEYYPAKLSGLSLVHSSGFPDNDAGKVKRQVAIDDILKNGIETYINGLTPKLFSPEHLKSMKENVEYIRQIGLATNPRGAINILTGMITRVDRNHILAEAQVPVLLIAGNKDQIIPNEQTFAVVGPNITQYTIEDCGHISPQEQPEQLIKQILAFSDSIYAK